LGDSGLVDSRSGRSRSGDESAEPVRAIILVDHGSRRAEAAGHLEAVAARVAERRRDWRVLHAHMDVGEPDLPSAIARCARDGVREIVVHPFFLNTGMHVQETIPGLIEAARSAHPDLLITQSAHLGLHDGLVDVVIDRIDETLAALLD